MHVQAYDGQGLILTFSPVFTHKETQEILSAEPHGKPEPTIGGYEEYTVDLYPGYIKKISSCVNEYLKCYEIKNNYTYKCSRVAEISKSVPRHFDSVTQSNNRVRDFVVVTYLTSFDMGEIVFPQHGVIFKPELGDTIIFPTGPFHQHLVNPAIGKRIIMRSEFIASEM
jgi:hypothetical protein